MNAVKAVGRLVEINHRKHRARAKENSFSAWLRQYCNNLKGFPVHITSEQRLERFLSALAKNDMSSNTPYQAFNAVIFSCEKVLGAEVRIIQALRARGNEARARRIRAALACLIQT
jgi:hypothetical protein